jgi:hypothetical protein
MMLIFESGIAPHFSRPCITALYSSYLLYLNSVAKSVRNASWGDSLFDCLETKVVVNAWDALCQA